MAFFDIAKQTMVAIVAKHTAITNHWFVAVEIPKHGKPGSSRSAYPRKSKSFPTMSEAKQFAKEMLSEGFKVTAGTLSPHHPKRRTVTASQIDQWIEEQE